MRATPKKPDEIFKAVADPTRRRLLDLLKAGPRTTGDLCGPFGLSRYAVMKHLGVLEGAGLINCERRGRERWNHLNAGPLQQNYERWVRGFEQHWSKSLQNLKTLVESRETENQTTPHRRRPFGVDPMSNAKNRSWGQFSLEQEIRIAAPRTKVFDALLRDINSWWGYRFAEGGKSTIRVEPTLGGKFYEDFGNGEGVLWGNVIYFKAPEILRLTGPLGMDTAVNSTYTYELAEAAGQTTLKLLHQASGFIDPKWGESHNEGWNELLGRFLKGWVEEGKPYTAFEERLH